MDKIKCKHNKCWWYPLTQEWYFEIKETECDDPDVRAYGIKYCPWCGMELPKNGKFIKE